MFYGLLRGVIQQAPQHSAHIYLTQPGGGKGASVIKRQPLRSTGQELIDAKHRYSQLGMPGSSAPHAAGKIGKVVVESKHRPALGARRIAQNAKHGRLVAAREGPGRKEQVSYPPFPARSYALFPAVPANNIPLVHKCFKVRLVERSGEENASHASRPHTQRSHGKPSGAA